jgi:AraC-like DNA-binding protein
VKQHTRRGRRPGWNADALLHLIDAYLDYCARTRGAARVDEFAARLGLDPSQVRRIFRAELRATPGEILRELQIRRAMVLLAESDETNDEVAAKCGFGTRATLQRAFRTRLNMSPAEYRRIRTRK